MALKSTQPLTAMRCTAQTSLPPPGAECLEILPASTYCSSKVLYRDSFTFMFSHQQTQDGRRLPCTWEIRSAHQTVVGQYHRNTLFERPLHKQDDNMPVPRHVQFFICIKGLYFVYKQKCKSVASISGDLHLLMTSQTNFLVSSDFIVQHDFFYHFFKFTSHNMIMHFVSIIMEKAT